MIVKNLLAASALLACSSLASAGLIVDTVTQSEKVEWGKTFKYSHDLTDGLNQSGDFTLGTAVAGTLSVEIYDDKKGWDEFLPEIILFTVEKFDFDTGGFTFGSSFSAGLEMKALAAINSDGFLDVAITSMLGDFYVGDSELSITTEEASVPEPASLALLGLGLAGLGLARRKSKA